MILAGPILRRVTSHSVSVFLALKERRWVQLKLYDQANAAAANFADDPIEWHPGFEYPLQPTVRLGEHLHVVVATVTIPETFDDGTPAGQSLAGLLPGEVYAYNAYFHSTPADTGESISLAQTSFGLLTSTSPVPLGYQAGWLPSFSLPPTDLAQINIIHGSCRKPHGEGTDMLTKVDDYLARDDVYQNPLARPHLLLLTGDQIYADDVDPILLWLLHHTSRALVGWHETFPGTGPGVNALSTGLATLADAVQQIVAAGTGAALSALPALEQALADAIEDVEFSDNWAENLLIQQLLKRQLSLFAEDAAVVVTAAGNTSSSALVALAADIDSWLAKHQEIFSDLRSDHSWGRAAVPKEAGNVDLLASLEQQVDLMLADPAATATQLLDQLAVQLDLEAAENQAYEGHVVRARIESYGRRVAGLQGRANVSRDQVDGLLAEIKAWLDSEPFTYTASRISPPQRAKELKQFAALTSDAMTAHLMFLGEFYMMYLFTWSDAMWPRDEGGQVRLPAFFEAVPNYALTGPLSKRGLESARDDLAEFAAGVAKVRRVLANIPTLMIFDDHEVTDDWNLNMDWIVSVNESEMGPQLLRNALAAYAVFQDWGNQPEDYATDDTLAGRRILQALTMPDPPPDPVPAPAPPPLADPDDAAVPDRASMVNGLFGLGPQVASQLPQVSLDSVPTALVGTAEGQYAMVKPDGRKRWDFAYRPQANAPFKIIGLDTRNHRAFPTELWAADAELPLARWGQLPQTGGYVAAANLIQPDELARQLTDRFEDDLLHLVISPAPVFGLPLVEDLFQRLSALSSGPEVADFEAWQGNPDGFQRFVDALRGPDVILLSGDVHYAYSNILTFLDDGAGPQPPPIMQLCASSMKNETGLTRFIGNVGREGRIVDWLRFDNFFESMGLVWDGITASIEDIGSGFSDLLHNLLNFSLWFDETAPMLYPLNPGSYVAYYLALKDAMLLDVHALTPRGLFAIGSTAIRYFFEDMVARSFDPDAQEGVYVHEGRSLQFLGDVRDHTARRNRAAQLNDAGVLDALSEPEFKLKQQPEVVGFNNFGRLAFSDDDGRRPVERASHELFWLTHDRKGKPEEVLASTIHGYIPRLGSFREEIVRIARAEHAYWHPAGAPVIKETDPAGLKRIEEYHAYLKPANQKLQQITPPDGQFAIGFYGARGGNETGPILHWSATFVSYVLKSAGAGDRFFYSPRHIDYVRRAKFNRSDDESNPFHLYDITEAGSEPQPGDLIVMWRNTQFGYADIETDDVYAGRAAHVDVAVSTTPTSLKAIGGNVSQTVKEVEYSLDNGKLRAADHFVAVIKIVGAP